MIDLYPIFVATVELAVVLFLGGVAIGIAQRWRP